MGHVATASGTLQMAARVSELDGWVGFWDMPRNLPNKLGVPDNVQNIDDGCGIFEVVDAELNRCACGRSCQLWCGHFLNGVRAESIRARNASVVSLTARIQLEDCLRGLLLR